MITTELDHMVVDVAKFVFPVGLVVHAEFVQQRAAQTLAGILVSGWPHWWRIAIAHGEAAVHVWQSIVVHGSLTEVLRVGIDVVRRERLRHVVLVGIVWLAVEVVVGISLRVVPAVEISPTRVSRRRSRIVPNIRTRSKAPLVHARIQTVARARRDSIH